MNLQQYWLVKKPAYLFKRILLLVGMCLFALLSIQATNAHLYLEVLLPLVCFTSLSKTSGKRKIMAVPQGGAGCGGGCAAGMHGDSGCGGGSGCSGGSDRSGCGGGGD